MILVSHSLRRSLRRSLLRRSLSTALALPLIAGLAATGCGRTAEPATPGAAAADASTTDGANDADTVGSSAADFRQDGPFAVGVQTYAVVQPDGRTLNVEAVYPAVAGGAAAGALGMASFCTNTTDQQLYQQLLAKAPKSCPTLTTDVLRDATPAQGKFPVVVFSHCHECTRFSSLALLRRLASHGIVVLAPDHAGNTLFDKLAGQGVALGAAFLSVRVADLKAVLDDAELAQKPGLPATLRAKLDLSQVGAMGHSFGSVTAGLFAQQDKRVRAAVGVAAPMQNPLLPGVDMKAMKLPVLLIVAVEDNSITVVGNQFLRDNFKDAAGPAWKLEVEDAGHWSFSDIAGLHEAFNAGCGDGERMTDGEPFAYLPVAEAQDIVASWVGAFFASQLRNAPGAAALLAAPPADKRAHIERK